MTAVGRLPSVTTLVAPISEGQLIGESRHSSKEFICSVRPSLNDRFRLETAGQVMELRQAENDPEQTFPDCLKRDLDSLVPNQSVAGYWGPPPCDLPKI